MEPTPKPKRIRKPRTPEQRERDNAKQREKYANDVEYRARRIEYAKGYWRVPDDAPEHLKGKC